MQENSEVQKETLRNQENENLKYNFDAVVVHGFGVVRKETSEGSVRFEPDIDGKMRIAGLTELVLEMVARGNEIPQIIISGGKTSKDKDISAEEMLLQRKSEFGSAKYTKFIERFNASPGMVKRRFLEKANLALLTVDPEGKIAKKLAQLFRQRHGL